MQVFQKFLRENWHYLSTNPEFYHDRGLGQIALYSQLLGIVGAGSFVLIFALPEYWNLFLYISMVCVFHSLEFYTTIMAHPKTTTSEAFLLNHSPEFNIAMAASVIEYILESFFWNKGAGVFKYLAFTGMAIAICGQIFRTVAMHTAGKSFTHLVAKSKTNEHVLVTDGIYSISRHPAYAGWFYWAVFTQLLLCNPICFVAYAFVAFSFFKTRIDWEEDNLLIFFGDKYKDYKKRVPTRIPFLE